ncbi:MAG TPA: chaperone modulator CbpM [Blastocatellia bacterium]|jgi:DNA-binding transcriptional MerR regulator
MMSARRYEIILRRDKRQQMTLDALASRCGLHPALVERFLEFGLIEPIEWEGERPMFDVSVVLRLQVIERLRRDLGINLAGVAVILEMVERLRALRSENDLLRSRL